MAGRRRRCSDWQQALEHWVEANDDCRRDILDKLYDEGPLPARELPDLTLVPWRSSGWNDDRNVRMLLELMVARGEVASAGREGRDRLWDLAERVYPDVPPVPLDEALRIRRERRLRALGIARARATVMPGEPNHVGEAGEPAVVEGVRGTWRVDPAATSTRPFAGRAALLSPLDRLVFDRKRMAELFEFDYQLEMYKPAAKRRLGYWAMPMLVRRPAGRQARRRRRPRARACCASTRSTRTSRGTRRCARRVEPRWRRWPTSSTS